MKAEIRSRARIGKWLPVYLAGMSFLLVFCSRELPPDGPETALFTYQVVSQQDGLVIFKADSSQQGVTYRWNFGDSTAAITTQSPRISHQFTRNATYQVQLTIDRSTRQRSGIQSVTVATRLARTFADLPSTKRDTIRLLYVLTDPSFVGAFPTTNGNHYDPYQNRVFVDFINRAHPEHPQELGKLVFQHIIYTLSADEMARFKDSGDPEGLMNQLFANPTDPLTQKLVAVKQAKAATRIVFFMKDPILPTGYPKYPYGGYAIYEGSYLVCLKPNAELAAHELGHSFGLAHDTLRDCQVFPLMVGGPINVQGTCGSNWNLYPEFQVKGYINQLVRLEAQTNQANQYVVPEYWRDQFPQDLLVKQFSYVSPSTTPYYRPGISMVQTLCDALVMQYNFELAPWLVTGLAYNPMLPSGRLAASSVGHPVYCPSSIK
ncbi:PKD domain-containing protein [Spirosoma panaciterrae]|uniref:PKD domain-containing protein n=1 Tax=Spirosoma panaciterrae TaxID=496058 RepID=UPI00039BDADA|nr:PKD domain-containing protein [Spirosoma panaciterrae]